MPELSHLDLPLCLEFAEAPLWSAVELHSLRWSHTSHKTRCVHHPATSYQYDDLNRVKTRSYGRATGVDWTPTVTHTYDVGMDCNFKGRLTQVQNSNSTTNYTCYDAMGRVLGTSQLTCGQTNAMSYDYNLAGGMTSQTYPSGRMITTGYDPAGRVNGISGPQSKIYATTFSYTAHGAVASMNLGNTLWEHTHFNGRLQPDEIGLGTSNGDSSKLKLEYAYNALGIADNNGNVLSQKISLDTMGTQTVIQQGYSYDPLNRLWDANESGGWHQTYTYDRYGNRTTVDNHGAQYLPTFSLNISESNNRITDAGFTYDAAGNLKQQPDGPGATTYKLCTYDAENRLTKLNGGAATYVYDGDGRRVKKIVDASTTTYVYNALGQLVAEYTNTSPTGNGGTSYLTADHLGSTRVVTDANANLVARHDYLPFGEEIGPPYGGRTQQMGYSVFDSTNQRFTGNERDSESALDYFLARYQASALGRFMTPDPLGGHQEDPQTLNRYAYVRNNPLTLTDPTGLDFRLQCGDESETCHGGHVGAYVDDGKGGKVFQETVVTTASLDDPKSGNTAVVNWNGVRITTAQGTFEGIFINGTPAADIQGDPRETGFSDFVFHIEKSDEQHGVLDEGTATYKWSRDQADVVDALNQMGAFSYLPEQVAKNPHHPGQLNFRFAAGALPNLFNYGPSPHFLVPADAKATVPIGPGYLTEFHVDSKTGPLHVACAEWGIACK